MEPVRRSARVEPSRRAGPARTRAPAGYPEALSALVVAGPDPGRVAEAAARAVAAVLGDVLVQVWLPAESGGRLDLAASHAARPGPVPIPPRTTLAAGQGLVGAVAGSPEPVLVRALRRERRLASPEWVRAEGLVSFAGLVPRAGPDAFGVLAVFTWRSRRFTRAEVSLLGDLAVHVAGALAGATRLRAADRRLRRLEALREIEREITLQQDSESLLRLVTQRATEHLDGDSATIFLLDEDGRHLRPRVSHNAGSWLTDVVLSAGQGLAGTVAERRQGLVVNDYPRSPFAIASFPERDHAVMAQPLLQGETLHGVLLVRRSQPDRPFTEGDLRELGDFAVPAAIALDNARRLGVAASRAERITAAAEVGRHLAATRDADRILDLIADKCRELLLVQAFGLFRPDVAGRLRYVRGFGLDPAFMAEHTLAPGEGVVGRALAERRSVRTADVLADPEVPLSPEARVRIETQGSRAIVAVPIVTGDEVLGVLAAYHPPGVRIDAEEIEFLETLAGHAAVALENARLFAEVVRRQEMAETLAAVTQSLTGSLVRQTVVTLVAEAVRRLLRCEGGAIGLTGPNGTIRLSARVGLGSEAFRDLVARPGEGVAGWVLIHGTAFVTSDYAADPRVTPVFAAAIRQAGIVSMLAVPVRLGEETVGVLYGFYDRVVTVSPEDLGLAQDLARVVAVAVANARLYDEARQREAEARALFEVGRLVAGTLDRERVLDLIVEKALELVGGGACGIFRLDPEGWLRYARGRGLSPPLIEGLRVRPGEGTSGRALVERRPVWTHDIQADPAVSLDPGARRLVEREGYRGVLSAPIEVQEEPFGALAVYWWEARTPTRAEVDTLASLATLAAVAIGNARLYEDAQAHEAEAVALAEASRRLNASLRREAILEALVDAAGRLVPARWWIEPAGSDPGRTAGAVEPGRGGDERPPALGARILAMAPGLSRVIRRPEDLAADDPDRALLAEQRVQALLAVAVGVGETVRARLVGAVSAGERPPGERELRLVAGVAERAGTALENARLFEELAQAYQDLKLAQDQLVRTEKLRALGEMASGVSHDFNNLLAAILGRVQLMLRQIDDPTFRGWLQMIEQAALDGAQTVRQIQEFTRVRRDQPTLTVALDQVVRDALEMTRPRWHREAQSRGREIRVVEDLQPVPPVDGQPAELREVLTNLILNALDAMPGGGVLRVATRERGDRVEVEVADSGTGMPEAVRRRIFEPFFTTKGPKGTGLGLAMAYGIVSRHRGEIDVRSGEGTGAVFTVRLPVGRARGGGWGCPVP